MKKSDELMAQLRKKAAVRKSILEEFSAKVCAGISDAHLSDAFCALSREVNDLALCVRDAVMEEAGK